MGKTPSLTVTLEAVTPLFLGGADPYGAPELRAPSFRGALRYWLRAALGGVYGDDAAGLHAIRRAEARVFGSTEADWGGASAVVIQCKCKEVQPRPVNYGLEKDVQTQKSGKTVSQPSGRDYLYWSMSGFRGRPSRQYYPEGSRFLLELRVRPGVSDNDQVFQEAIAALWLLVQLGGVGSRSRRIGGSLSVLEPEEACGFSFVLRSENPKEIAQELGKGLTAVRKLFQQHHPEGRNLSLSNPSEFDILHPTVCKVWVLGIWRSSAQAVEAIGVALRDFRTYREPDHTEVAKWLTGTPIQTVERSVFGLPLPFRYSGKGLQGIVQGRTKPPEKAINRRASPLWLTVSKTDRGQYVGVATLFCSRFLPKGEQLHGRQDRVPALSPPADYRLIEQFIAEKFHAEEVPYA
ncbi:MAG: type III-B CRISPR module RAMP protein Cmr1 [Anaerolineae bacterium]|nr:type III-B CRISPR module RAMP protein Cmr1 [Anaerolineae bacterium]MDW8068811.1 type III-B CRISPR module RAMP protein Cmr1 [Anaerolineae bacterium]